LLLGNGFSIACDPIFRYDKLYDAAVSAGLSDRAQAVFQRLGTNNFEGVLRMLEDAHWVSHTYGLLKDDAESEIHKDVQIVKEALIHAVATSHLEHSGKVDDQRKAAAAKFFKPFQNIFTTNYDLLAYWVTLSQSPVVFQDGFRPDDDDPDAKYVVFSERLGQNRGLLYLHGALHLNLKGGELRKYCWSRTHTPLTELIKAGLQNDIYPLFVAEGTPDNKLAQIQRVGYLWYCLDKLARIASPLVVYGHSLDAPDQHIVDVLVSNTKLRSIYLGVHGGADSASGRLAWRVAERMKEERRRLITKKGTSDELSVTYFASETARVWDPTLAS
jgi:hypothetical protein